jgi:RHS repeat-associated protein
VVPNANPASASDIPADARHIIYDDAGNLASEFTSDGRPIQDYVWLGNQPVAVITNGEVITLHADHLGSPRLGVDEHQKTRWEWQNDDPSGGNSAKAIANSAGATVEINSRFPGQYWDRETGLHQNWHREYEAVRGRYVQGDPIGLVGGWNRYLYVGGDPKSRGDRTGLDYWIESGAVGETGGSLHRGVCVGNPNGAHRCISFGATDGTQPIWSYFGTDGEVYWEDVGYGEIVDSQYYSTTEEVDQRIYEMMLRWAGTPGNYNLATNNCRNFSRRAILLIYVNFGGRRVVSPTRLPPPRRGP